MHYSLFQLIRTDFIVLSPNFVSLSYEMLDDLYMYHGITSPPVPMQRWSL